jgi:hypothetical protein
MQSSAGAVREQAPKRVVRRNRSTLGRRLKRLWYFITPPRFLRERWERLGTSKLLEEGRERGYSGRYSRLKPALRP